MFRECHKVRVQLYDTLSRCVNTLEPYGEKFGFYCCGPTVYNFAHIGNFRTFLAADLLCRVLKLAGYNPFYVRNITDVDDKTIAGAQQNGIPLQEFTGHWKNAFRADCHTLGLLQPNCEPSAVEHMDGQMALVQALIEKNFAYIRDGSVYFDVSTWKNYGRLSRLKERELRQVAEISPDKKAVEDFALWKAHKPADGTVFWDSPFGRGRPGWHVECSAMALKYLGNNFGVHGGGIDLLFPHHENEIAQSEAATGQPFTRHWFHVAHLCVNGEKMSKSLGNLYTLADIKQMGYSPMELRYTLLAGHYRQPLNFTMESLHASRKALARLARFGRWLRELAGIDVLMAAEFRSFTSAWDALCDDLNVPEALGRMFAHVHQRESDPPTSAQAAEELAEWQRLLFALGIRPEAEEIPAEIDQLARARSAARKEKNFAKADALRRQVEDFGWTVEDTADGYNLHKKR
ncbi:MAG: cysteine--tRNA ligase [Puniceicoccales bacterium]|jgi:cysteinyl-tRNA synthetase|nr:cysteine--tRNA ligase [Puniceicoccales bacterium]